MKARNIKRIKKICRNSGGYFYNHFENVFGVLIKEGSIKQGGNNFFITSKGIGRLYEFRKLMEERRNAGIQENLTIILVIATLVLAVGSLLNFISFSPVKEVLIVLMILFTLGSLRLTYRLFLHPLSQFHKRF